MQGREYIDRAFEIKEVDEETGIFKGYGSVFGNTDLGGDIILPGAFSATLKKRGVKGVRMLLQHDSKKPIGKWLALEEDSKGLYVEGQLILELIDGKETYIRMKNEIMSGLSIGFDFYDRKKDVLYDDQTGIRRIKKLDLWEISPVTFPMNTSAQVTRVKTAETPHDLELALRDAGLSRNDAKFIVSRCRPALRDAGAPTNEQMFKSILSELKKFNGGN